MNDAFGIIADRLTHASTDELLVMLMVAVLLIAIALFLEPPRR